MAGNVTYDLCPETGIACVMVNQGSGLLKIDLMPDEAAKMKGLLQSGDKAGVRTLLGSVDAEAATMDDDALEALAGEVC